MMGPARRGRGKGGGTTAEPPTQEKASRGEGEGGLITGLFGDHHSFTFAGRTPRRRQQLSDLRF